jgi:hypothetical protein
MLQNKRMVSAMETWNGKVTEYRRWYLRRQERASDVPDFARENSKKKKKSSGGMFVCLGGATMEEEEGYEYYGPGGDEKDEYAAIVQNKNRPGQRARKAKALAIQARKEGRKWDNSINWREKKTTNNGEKQQQIEDTVKQPVQAAEIATMGKTWKEEGKEHPSWAARQSQKAGIVAFTGKKITFD